MSEAIAVSKALSPAQILARIKTVAGPGSGLDADLVVAPIPRNGSSFGGYPSFTSGIASVVQPALATYARFPFGV